MSRHCQPDILLRLPESEDLDFLTAIRNDVAIQRSLMSDYKHNSVDDVNGWLERRTSDENSAFFIIALITSNAPCGFIQLTNTDTRSHHSWLGICVSNQFQGRHFAQQAISLLEQHSISTLNLNKIMLQVLQENFKAISLYERLGYKRVGVLSDHYYDQGRYHNALLMEKVLNQDD